MGLCARWLHRAYPRDSLHSGRFRLFEEERPVIRERWTHRLGNLQKDIEVMQRCLKVINKRYRLMRWPNELKHLHYRSTRLPYRLLKTPRQ